MDDGNNFPSATDVLAEILVRLPPNARRRLRLVCPLWRAVIDQRTVTDMQARGKILVVTTDGITYVVDVQSPWRPARALSWPTDRTTRSRSYKAMNIVGTCNGIVCMCDDREAGGALTLVNPSTGEALNLPQLPMSDVIVKVWRNCSSRKWHQTYSFAYHPMTGRYKVVHIPSHFDPAIWEPETVHVFTLGEASWRDVHAGPTARCALGAFHLADVDGMVYWMTKDTGRVVEFDLKDESVTPTEPLPITTGPDECWLTKVHGRLGAVVGGDDSVTVWVLEGERWSCRYVVEAHRLSQYSEERLRWELTRPHFAHGDYVLTHGGWGKFVRASKMSETTRTEGGVVQIRRNDRDKAMVFLRYHISQTFAYIETKEALSVYGEALVNVGSIGS